MAHKPGRHFLQLPGPTNVPDRVLRAMDTPTIDHRGPEFPDLTGEVIAGLKGVFGTKSDAFIFPASGSGMWEAALVNTLSPGDAVLAFDQGFFSAGWQNLATKMGLVVHSMPGDWRRALNAGILEEKLAEDTEHAYKAVLAVHNETSTGVTSDIGAVGKALRTTDHPALLMVDAVSSLGSMDFQHDEWHVDVTISGSQKGLMLPPGLGFNAVSEKALKAASDSTLPSAYWDWRAMKSFNDDGFFPYTPATNMLFGLRESLRMLREEGLSNVYARHARLAEATRRAVEAWGFQLYAERANERSDTVSAVLMQGEITADDFRRTMLDRFNMSLGGGLGRLRGQIFRIGHLGDFNELMLAGTLCGIELGFRVMDVPFRDAGIEAALSYLAETQ